MNTVLKIVLSMSCSGGLLVLTLLIGKRLWKNKVSRQWQYYIWLIAILRMLLPFGPERNLPGSIYRNAEQAVSENYFFSWKQKKSEPEACLAGVLDKMPLAGSKKVPASRDILSGNAGAYTVPVKKMKSCWKQRMQLLLKIRNKPFTFF